MLSKRERNGLGLLVIVLLVGTSLVLVGLHEARPRSASTRITGTPDGTAQSAERAISIGRDVYVPKDVSLDDALARGVGVIHVYDGIPKNIHIAINDAIPTSVGMAIIQARQFLGNDFHIDFVSQKTKDGRPYVLLMCRNEI